MPRFFTKGIRDLSPGLDFTRETCDFANLKLLITRGMWGGAVHARINRCLCDGHKPQEISCNLFVLGCELYLEKIEVY